MSTASTSAASAPSGAGPTSEQSSPSGGNSATASQTSTRQEGGAASSKPQNQTTRPADDDPEWDFGNGQKRKRSEVTKRLSEISKGAQKANEENKSLRARQEKLDAALRKRGIDPDALDDDEKAEALFDKISQERMARKFEDATLDPAEREKRDLKAENDRLKKEAEERAENERKTEHQKQVAANADEIAGHFATALKEHGLPVNAKSVWLMASLLQGARKSKQKVSLADLAQMTNQHIRGDIGHYLPKGDVDALKSLLGDDWLPKGDVSALKKLYGAAWPEMAEAIRQDLLTEHEAKFSPKPKQPTRTEEPKQALPRYYSMDEWNQAQSRARKRR